MKISQISTQSIYNNLRHSMSNLQRDLLVAQREVSTGFVADVGLKLGENSSKIITFVQDIERLNAIMDTNGLTGNRLAATLSATGSVSEISQDLLSTLTASVGQDATSGLTVSAGQTAIAAITSLLNTTLNGEAIFGGINSTEPPIVDFEAGGAKAALDIAFQSHFGFMKTDAGAGIITSTAMTDFLDNVVAPMFTGTGWSANFSNASDRQVTARIGLDESIEGSISANESGFQNAMFAAVIASEFSSDNLSGQAKSAAAQKAINLVGEASGDLADLQGYTGLLTNRIEQASNRLAVQIDEFTTASDQMVAADPYEAATRLNLLITQIEASYTLTGRIQQLNLMSYIR